MARWDQQGYEEAGSPRVNPKEKKPFSTEYSAMAEKLVASGANQKDLAFVFGTSQDVIREWKRDHPEFKNAVKRGKEITLSRLIGAGIKAAEGATVTTTTYTGTGIVGENGMVEELIPGTEVDVKKEVKEIPPNDKLIQFLANTLSRQLGKEDWVSKQFSETKVSGEVQHKIDASSVQKQIEEQSARLIKHVDSNVIDAEVIDNQS